VQVLTQGEALGAGMGHDQIHGCDVLSQVSCDEGATGKGFNLVSQASQVLLEVCLWLILRLEHQDVSTNGCLV
jgi:hypothetical protein